jgi:hypothetical protein
MRCFTIVLKTVLLSVGIIINLSTFVQAQSQNVNYPTVASLSSLKSITKQDSAFKKNLTFSSGEVSLGASAQQASRSDLVESLQYLMPGNKQQGLVTLCPFGSHDNSILPECAVVGIARSYQVQKENMERWVSEIKPQLVGQTQWDVSPNNNLHNLMLKNAVAIEPAFDQCLERILQSKDTVQSCFQAPTSEETLMVIFRLCYGEIKALENGLDLSSNISTPITYCAVDRKTGIVASLFLDEVRGKITVTLSAPISLFELYSRSKAAEKQQIQKEYTPPKL